MANTEQELIISPLGHQGPKVGIRISGVEDIQALDKAMGELLPQERKTLKGILSATKKAGLNRID
jgi:hypothetical protein